MASGSDTKLRWRLADEDGAAGAAGAAGDGADWQEGQSPEGQSPDRQGALFSGDQLVDRHVGMGEFRGMEFLHVNARTIINQVPASSRMPFRYTINAYRGCSHACTYCFARPTHEYLGLDTGEDFERKIVVKVNAVERLRAELVGRRWAGDHIAMGTNTDPYQRCEGKYHLTRGVVEVLAEAANPFSILTKSTLILRDLPLLATAAQRTDVRASLSIGTLDPEIWRLTEPGTPHPRKRVDAVRRLNDAGVSCGVLIAPILPGLSDREDQLEEVVEACVDAGAVSISSVALHLRPGVREHFMGQLAQSHPHLVEEYEKRYRRAYLAGAEQQALSERVRRMVERARGRSGRSDQTGHGGFRLAPRLAGRPEAPTPSSPRSTPEDQLSFDLSATS